MVDLNLFDLKIPLNSMFMLFFYAIILDFITGIVSAAKEGRLKSAICRNGIFRSIGECFLLISSIMINNVVCDVNLDPIITYFIIGFTLKEFISILGNLSRLGVWIPQFLKKSIQDEINKIDKGEK